MFLDYRPLLKALGISTTALQHEMGYHSRPTFYNRISGKRPISDKFHAALITAIVSFGQSCPAEDKREILK